MALTQNEIEKGYDFFNTIICSYSGFEHKELGEPDGSKKFFTERDPINMFLSFDNELRVKLLEWYKEVSKRYNKDWYNSREYLTSIIPQLSIMQGVDDLSVPMAMVQAENLEFDYKNTTLQDIEKTLPFFECIRNMQEKDFVVVFEKGYEGEYEAHQSYRNPVNYYYSVRNYYTQVGRLLSWYNKTHLIK